MHRCCAQLGPGDGDAGDVGDRLGTRHVGERCFGHDDDVSDAEDECGARYTGSGHDEHGGDNAGGIGKRLRNSSPCVEAYGPIANLGS